MQSSHAASADLAIKPWIQSYPPNTPAELGPLAHSSIGALVDKACLRFADRPAFTCMGKTIDYKTFGAQSAAIGAWLQSKGLQKGDRVRYAVRQSDRGPQADRVERL